jgi:hypothetical protein
MFPGILKGDTPGPQDNWGRGDGSGDYFREARCRDLCAGLLLRAQGSGSEILVIFKKICFQQWGVYFFG